MALPNPTRLTDATRFRPTNLRAHSRSPSRSPVRTAQFRAQHLDPLLRNLSPESTLRALQKTETIQEGSGQSILTKSIADATPSEREIGIRAAFAAQKLREWRNEISHWQWPNRRDCALGAGFLPPQDQIKNKGAGNIGSYLGHLSVRLVDQYEQRIDEIRDDMESLEMEDIKDHVLAAHNGSSASTSFKASSFGMRTSSYGRMRDFTALITATVIQALPDLAVLTALLDTWNVRLNGLRQTPMLISVMDGTGRGVLAATASTEYPKEAALLTQQDYDETKALLGSKVAEFGNRIDKLLDMLEGQDDALPQSWIDCLENVELVYATWVVETQRAVAQNESLRRQNKADANHSLSAPIASSPVDGSVVEAESNAHLSGQDSSRGPSSAALPSRGNSTKEVVDQQRLAEARAKIPPPPLSLEPPSHHGHRRGVSEVSVADSTYSAMSGISEAEIVEARQTQVLPSPKVSMVDNPSAPAREDMGFFGSKEEAIHRPPMVQRASTASFEVVPREQLKRVDLRRSMSADLIAKMSLPRGPESTPSKALQQLNGRPSTGTTPLAELEDPTSLFHIPESSVSSVSWPSPLAVQPLRIQPRPIDPDYLGSPVSPILPSLPRKSSKRQSLPANTMFSQLTPITSFDTEKIPVSNSPPGTVSSSERKTALKKSPRKDESLESKIQSILTTLPTKIRLTDDSNPEPAQVSSVSSTRATTPAPALTLSAAKLSQNRPVAGTDVRVFHLHQHGQSRETAPIKLFVRAVGENGERVMVRVGGGWADLGEYLKEYSAHHRSKSIADGGMEVAQYPGKTSREPAASSIPPSTGHPRRSSGSLIKATSRRSGSLSSTEPARGSTGRSSRSPSPPPKVSQERSGWTMPPVPAIPASYTVSQPTTTTTVVSRSNGRIETRFDHQGVPQSQPASDTTGSAQSPGIVRSTTTTTPGVSTTTTMSTSTSRYTPLGAAGPKANARRSVTLGALTDEKASDAWVQGMVGKARAVSGSTATHGRTISTNTAVNSTPPSRRASTANMLSSPISNTSSPASSSKMPKEGERKKSRLSLADVSGIRRVFLRRKSEK